MNFLESRDRGWREERVQDVGLAGHDGGLVMEKSPTVPAVEDQLVSVAKRVTHSTRYAWAGRAR
eukprot:4053179-Pyramimonas_sp.AAC.1